MQGCTYLIVRKQSLMQPPTSCNEWPKTIFLHKLEPCGLCVGGKVFKIFPSIPFLVNVTHLFNFEMFISGYHCWPHEDFLGWHMRIKMLHHKPQSDEDDISINKKNFFIKSSLSKNFFTLLHMIHFDSEQCVN